VSIFATEFPVTREITNSEFAASAIAWIRGISKSTVLQNFEGKEQYDDDFFLEAGSGETLQFKSYEDSAIRALGVRHELPDLIGRVWRTECVVSHCDAGSFLRVRGQCLLNDSSATVMTPKKPFFITQAIEDGWGSNDGDFAVSNTPFHLNDTNLGLASEVVKGEQECLLPCVYVSRGNDNTLSLDADVLARKLAGLAHVVVEPSRKFSFRLMENSFRRNPYGGAVGIFIRGRGEVIRLYAKSGTGKQHTKIAEVISAVVDLNSKQSARSGLEWQTLQELQGRRLRKQVSENLSEELSDYIDEFDREISAKDEKIKNLQQLLELANAIGNDFAGESPDIISLGLAEKLGSQLYDGEFSDRLRYFMLDSLSLNRGADLDHRTIELVSRIVENTSYSGRAISLVGQIKSAGKDGNQMSKNLGNILSGFGYAKSTEGKHVKYTPPTSLFGLPNEILPSTPSDSQRGGKNKSSDIIRNMGLSKFR